MENPIESQSLLLVKCLALPFEQDGVSVLAFVLPWEISVEVLVNIKHKIGKRQQSQQIKDRVSNPHFLNDGASAAAQADLVHSIYSVLAEK